MPTEKPLSPAVVFRRVNQLIGKIRELEEEIKAVRKRCSHHGCVSYSSDPSGNNDSGYDCSACGQSWRRWPVGVKDSIDGGDAAG